MFVGNLVGKDRPQIKKLMALSQSQYVDTGDKSLPEEMMVCFIDEYMRQLPSLSYHSKCSDNLRDIDIYFEKCPQIIKLYLQSIMMK